MAQLVEWTWEAVGSIANKWVFVALFATALVFWFGYFERQKKKYAPARTFDGRVEGFRPSQAREILAEFTPEALNAYLFQARVVDMIFPIVYSMTAAVAIRLAAPNLTGLRWLILLPFVTAIFDWMENICVAIVIGRFRANPDKLGSVPTVLLVAQRAKWMMFGAVMVVVAVLAVGWARRRFM